MGARAEHARGARVKLARGHAGKGTRGQGERHTYKKTGGRVGREFEVAICDFKLRGHGN